MIKFSISDKQNIPKYKQIVEQIKRCVAICRLKPGERLPSVRELAQTLQINPGTVSRAYQELEQEGILGASTWRGTNVLDVFDSPQKLSLRQSRLAAMLESLLLDTVSQGYNPEVLEVTFTQQLAFWRTQRETEEATIENIIF